LFYITQTPVNYRQVDSACDNLIAKTPGFSSSAQIPRCLADNVNLASAKLISNSYQCSSRGGGISTDWQLKSPGLCRVRCITFFTVFYSASGFCLGVIKAGGSLVRAASSMAFSRDEAGDIGSKTGPTSG